MQKVLIVEDDPVIARELKQHLSAWGYDAETVGDFTRVMEEFAEFSPQLVLLDISLPFYNGFHWCTELRKLSPVPIMFISSASDNMNIVMAMNMGGDDFVSKPFDMTVLTAKIQALMRRSYALTENSSVIERGDVSLNVSELSIRCGKQKVELSKNESRILEMLMTNGGKCMEREDIMAYLWENDSFVDDNTLTVNITRIRKKLDSIGAENYIVTKKGLGYMVK